MFHVKKIMVGYSVLLTSFLFGLTGAFTLGDIFETPERCYEELGCLKNGFEWRYNRLFIFRWPANRKRVDTRFFFFSRNQVQTITDFSYFLQPDKFNTKLPIKFIIHGFMDNSKSDWLLKMKDELLKNSDFNVIVVDWNSRTPYGEATVNTRLVALEIKNLINYMKNNTELNLDNVHLIGHSLGAHIAGYVGKEVKGIGRITGLDPALPLFEYYHPNIKLQHTDAKFVDVIHTDGGPNKYELMVFGIMEPIGHVDFYPNGGYMQPGCTGSKDIIPQQNYIVSYSLKTINNIKDEIKIKIKDWEIPPSLYDKFAYNHVRAIKLFIETINSKFPLKAIECDSYHKFKKHKCLNNHTLVMGFYAENKYNTTRSKYYLKTTDKSPFYIPEISHTSIEKIPVTFSNLWEENSNDQEALKDNTETSFDNEQLNDNHNLLILK